MSKEENYVINTTGCTQKQIEEIEKLNHRDSLSDRRYNDHKASLTKFENFIGLDFCENMTVGYDHEGKLTMEQIILEFRSILESMPQEERDFLFEYDEYGSQTKMARQEGVNRKQIRKHYKDIYDKYFSAWRGNYDNLPKKQ